jgi:hypothetical protein
MKKPARGGLWGGGVERRACSGGSLPRRQVRSLGVHVLPSGGRQACQTATLSQFGVHGGLYSVPAAMVIHPPGGELPFAAVEDL